MKLIYTFLILTLSSFVSANNQYFHSKQIINNELFAWNVFVPESGAYVKSSINTENISINGIAEELGYNTSQFSIYNKFGDHPIQEIMFKAFTTEIICVLTDETVGKLNQKLVDDYLSDFKYEKQYDAYSIENDLKEAIEQKSLTLEFINGVFDQSLTNINGSFIAQRIGYKLYFKDGILNNFTSADGLNKWAKRWKQENFDFYMNYEIKGIIKYGDDQQLRNYYINTQADAYAKIPNGFRNEFVPYYKDSDGTYNFKMIAVAHYDDTMSLDEFKIFNKDEYELTNEFNDEDGYKRTTYRLLNTLYTFDQNGKLINSFLSN